jgi:hypothetical protein
MVDYDFRSLSPIDFEAIVRDLLNADLGIKLTAFAEGKDGGIDLYDVENDVVVQCKHQPDAKKAAMVRAAKAEAGRDALPTPETYHFATSASLSPDAVDAVRQALSPFPVPGNGVWHRGALNSALARNELIRKRHFKLWLNDVDVIDHIINNAEWQRSEALLSRISERVKYYVFTPAFGIIQDTLISERVVLITGAPGVGKSTLAEMLLLDLWNDGWKVYNVGSDIDEAWRQLRKNENKVAFYYDDFLGQTNVAELQKNEAASINAFVEHIRHTSGEKLLILTSREQVLNQVMSGTDDRAARIAEEQPTYRVLISEITRLDRARMLFNYLFFTFPEKEHRNMLARDRRFLKVIDHAGFNPRLIESVALQSRGKTPDAFYEALFDALAHPDLIWRGSFASLSPLGVAALFQLATAPDGVMEESRLRAAVKPSDSRDWIQCLKVLEATWIRITLAPSGAQRIELYDPSRRDYLLDRLEDDSTLAFVLGSLSGIDQLAYLIRLAQLDTAPRTGKSTTRRTRLAELISDRGHELDAYAVKLMKLSRQAIKVEQRRAAHSSSKTTITTYHAEEGQEKLLSSLIDLSSICFGSIEMSKSELLIDKYLAGLLADITNAWLLDSSTLFRLCEILSQPDLPPWAHDAAMDLADYGFEAYVGIDDLRYFFSMSSELRDGNYHTRGTQKLSEALDKELVAIREQDDPALMSQWLDDVVDIAERHGLELDVEHLRVHIEDLDQLIQPPPELNTRRPDLTSATRVSDSVVVSLFQKLSS